MSDEHSEQDELVLPAAFRAYLASAVREYGGRTDGQSQLTSRHWEMLVRDLQKFGQLHGWALPADAEPTATPDTPAEAETAVALLRGAVLFAGHCARLQAGERVPLHDDELALVVHPDAIEAERRERLRHRTGPRPPTWVYPVTIDWDAAELTPAGVVVRYAYVVDLPKLARPAGTSYMDRVRELADAAHRDRAGD